jgi:hypothetical protein
VAVVAPRCPAGQRLRNHQPGLGEDCSERYRLHLRIAANPPANVDDGSTSTAWYGTNDTYYKNSSSYDYSFTAGGVLLDLGQQVSIGKIVATPAKAQAFAV